MLVKIFCSYAHADREFLEELKKHLRPLQRQQPQLIDAWYDDDIMAGEDWQHEINAHLNAAQIILLLISSDFIESDYCYCVEMQRALERHQQEEAYVIPVILRTCVWQTLPFGYLQHLPKRGKPVFARKKRHRDAALSSVVEGILEVIQKFLLRKSLEECKYEHYMEALKTIEQALTADRNYVATRPGKGHVLSDVEHPDLDQYKEALIKALDSVFHRLSQDRLLPLAWYIKGKLLHDLKRNAEALGAYTQAIQLGRKDADIYRDRATVFRDLKRFREALLDFEKALQSNKDDIWILTQKGITMRDLERAEEALAIHEKAIQLSREEDTWVITEKAITLRCFKRFDEALVEHKRAEKANPNDVWAKVQEAITLRDAQRWDESLEAHDRAIALNENDAWLFSEKAVTLRLCRRFDDALIEHERAIKVNPNDARTQVQEAITLRDAKRWEKSIEAHKKAIELDPNDALLHFEMAETLRQMANTHDRRRYEEAIASFDEAIRLNPYDARYLTWKAITLRDSSL